MLYESFAHCAERRRRTKILPKSGRRAPETIKNMTFKGFRPLTLDMWRSSRPCLMVFSSYRLHWELRLIPSDAEWNDLCWKNLRIENEFTDFSLEAKHLTNTLLFVSYRKIANQVTPASELLLMSTAKSLCALRVIFRCLTLLCLIFLCVCVAWLCF